MRGEKKKRIPVLFGLDFKYQRTVFSPRNATIISNR